MSNSQQTPLRFKTQKALAHRLVLSTLTGRPIHVSQIRPSSHTNPGIAPHEISLLRLLEAVTNGSHIEISYTGTTLLYQPGLITGSAPGTGASKGVIKHELPATCTRGVSYFLIALCLLAPFSKAPVNVLFTGPGVITSATLQETFLWIARSNAGPGGLGGAGEVQLVFGHQVRLPKTVHLLNPGRIKRVRGVAYCTGVSASNNARMIESARGVLNPIIDDTYIFSDVSSAPLLPSGNSSNSSGKTKIGIGFGLSLVAESTTGSIFAADVASPPSGAVPPEDLGQQCAFQLLDSISLGGSVSLIAAPTLLTLMAMGSEDVGRVQVGKDVIGNESIIALGRDLRTFGANGWGLREADGEGDLVVSVVGKGIGNVGRKIT